METFYTDKGKVFECQIAVEGADIDETRARLILMFENKRNLIFFGDVDSDGTCQIAIPALKDLKESKGTAILEVVSDSTLFEPWESKFELKPSKRVTVEVRTTEKKNLKEEMDRKPVISVTTKQHTETINTSSMVKRKIK